MIDQAAYPGFNKAMAFTVYDRVDYLREVLASWRTVRGTEDWLFYATIEPSDRSQEVFNLLEDSFMEMGVHFVISTNPERYGVLHHPWVVFDHLFAREIDFVVRVEDDLTVSDDFLEYMDWAREHFAEHKGVAAVVGYTDNIYGAPNEVVVEDRFSPWNWGTWKDRWDEYIGPTWDHDYSTYNESPGNQSGWDWNLNTRVLPQLNKRCVFPKLSRVQNIGQVGTHAQAHDFPQSSSFRPHFDAQEYHQSR